MFHNWVHELCRSNYGTICAGRNGEAICKTFHILNSSLIALALLPVPNVFAANRGPLHVSSPEDVAGQTLNAGDYIVLWEVRARTSH